MKTLVVSTTGVPYRKARKTEDGRRQALHFAPRTSHVIMPHMQKLIILINVPVDDPRFEDGWPDFLKHAENMPGLLRESTSRVSHILFGDTNCTMVHELFFESLANLEAAMQSAHGRKAGEVLQRITGSRFTLMFADHHEDTAENLRQIQSKSP